MTSVTRLSLAETRIGVQTREFALVPMLFFGMMIARAAVSAEPPSRPVVLKFDEKQSRVYARVIGLGVGHSHAVEGRLLSGEMDFEGKKGKLVFDMRSFEADTPAARRKIGLDRAISDSDRRQTNINMRSDLVLGVDRHPTSILNIRSIHPLNGQKAGGKGRYQIKGSWTLRKTSKEIDFIASLRPEASEGWIRVEGKFSMLQTDYGIKPYSALGGLAKVSDKVEILGELVGTMNGQTK